MPRITSPFITWYPAELKCRPTERNFQRRRRHQLRGWRTLQIAATCATAQATLMLLQGLSSLELCTDQLLWGWVSEGVPRFSTWWRIAQVDNARDYHYTIIDLLYMIDCFLVKLRRGSSGLTLLPENEPPAGKFGAQHIRLSALPWAGVASS